jgi:hypothetical protein
MQSLSDDERREVLGEVIFDELKAIREYVQEIPYIRQKLHEVDVRLINVEDMLIVVEAVVRDHEADLKQIKHHLALA